MRICGYGECGRPVLAKDLCSSHYEMRRRGEELRPIRASTRGGSWCSFSGCENRASGKGLCPAHRRQQTLGEPLRALVRGRQPHFCAFETCERQARSRGFCDSHSKQISRGRALQPLHTPKYRYELANGYVMLKRPGHPNAQKNGMVLEHVEVMSDHLGRPLWPDENVHHVNGQRADNRLENLELWSTRQPKGQRAEDKVEFAIEMLRRYRPDLLKEPDEQRRIRDAGRGDRRAES